MHAMKKQATHYVNFVWSNICLHYKMPCLLVFLSRNTVWNVPCHCLNTEHVCVLHPHHNSQNTVNRILKLVLVGVRDVAFPSISHEQTHQTELAVFQLIGSLFPTDPPFRLFITAVIVPCGSCKTSPRTSI